MKKEELKKEIAKISLSALIAAISLSPLTVMAGEGSSCGKGSCGKGGEMIAEGEEVIGEGEEIVAGDDMIVEEEEGAGYEEGNDAE